MLNNESNIWDKKYESSRGYNSQNDYLFFSKNNPTIKEIQRYISDGMSVLEIGSGTGELISYLKNNYKSINAFGVDFSSSSIEKSKEISKKFNTGVNFTLANIKKMPFGDNSFDILFGDQVIGHVEGLDEVFLEIKRVLKPGGLCFLTTPNKLRIDGWDLYKKISTSHFGYTQNSFLPWQLKKEILSNGLEYLSGYGDMFFLFRNIDVIKSKFRKKNISIPKNNLPQKIRESETSEGIKKKIYNFLDKLFPWWSKVTIGVIARKN